ncbi:MAG: sulfite exporter TauE/SafE family protein [Opitutaceae bacterium]
MSFEAWQWSLLVLGAVTIGMAKTGIPGLGIMFVAIFANIMPAKTATGLVLPMLILADVVAVFFYRRHAVIKYVIKLFPWTAAGVVLGTVALAYVDNQEARLMVGIILIVMISLHVVKEWGQAGRKLESEVVDHAVWFAPLMGIVAGFTTQVANAAGPVMILYLLAMRLPKMEFMGTGAIFFLALNVFKVPFMVGLDMITLDSLTINLLLAPAILLGTLLGRLVIQRINQKAFQNLAIGLAFVASIKLLF